MRENRRVKAATVKTKWIDRRTGDVVVPDKTSAVLVFVNPTSGGRLGPQLLENFRKLLNPLQVVDLSKETPEAAFQRFSGKAVRIAVCGGDGTVGWIMNSAAAAKLTCPVSIFPLGTGNDLSRALNWGGGATLTSITPECLARYVSNTLRASQASLDRWKVTVTDTATGAVKTFTMNNYVSIGIDAEIGMKFHRERQEHPERFTSQGKNVFKYALYGFEGSFEGVPLGDGVTATADGGTPINVNPHWKGLVVNNLPCYHGGKDFWGKADGDTLSPVDISDGKLEVMGLSGTFHIGLVHVSLDSALRLAQPRQVQIRCNGPICIQIDGEPFDHSACTIDVTLAATYPVLRCPDGISGDMSGDESGPEE